MIDTVFVGRKIELELLNRLWQSRRATLLILYGRRRVGKTRLLTQWLQQHTEDALYWMAEPTSAHDQLRSFSQALNTFFDPETPASPDFSYDSWEHALRQVSLMARDRRVALLIDEVTYVMDINPDMAGTLQKAWDHWLSNSNVMLALCGSQMGLMQRHLLDYQAPLYGRATATLKLPSLPYGVTKDYFTDYDARERVKVYSIWGGVPAYWERLNIHKSVMDNLREQLMPAHAWMLDESRLLLQDFINDPYNYVGIMRAIADGKQTMSEISKRIGLSSGHTSKYLSVLRETSFVQREVPVSKRETDSRMGRYVVTDPYLRFYYRFLAAYQSKLALGQQDQMQATIEEDLPAFIAHNSWPEICRTWLLLASANGELPVAVEHVGSEWKRSFMIDVAGIDETAHTLVLGSCFWETTPPAAEVIDNLIRRTNSILPDGDDWRVYFMAFSADGWPETEAQALDEMLQDLERRKWQSAGVRLMSLDEVDEDLGRWSTAANAVLPEVLQPNLI